MEANMIDKLIENEQFEEALAKLDAKYDDESVYKKLICLYGLKRFEEAYSLSKASLNSVEKNYYDVFHHPSKLIAVVCWEK